MPHMPSTSNVPEFRPGNNKFYSRGYLGWNNNTAKESTEKVGDFFCYTCRSDTNTTIFNPPESSVADIRVRCDYCLAVWTIQ